MSAPPRVRIAPSPTGFFHVGNAWTAQFNWLFARATGGTFILRIEDTDAERNREDWVLGIQDALRWLGLDWDEGPVRQSERGMLYADAAARLFEAGSAYWCDCTRAVIDARTAQNATPGYDRHCRERGLGPGEGRALRFAVPLEGEVVVHDVLRGEPTFAAATIEDFVLVRSSGGAMFILANAVDDLEMGITHVIRGEEHLPNTPKGLLLWSALAPEASPPVFAHLPLLVNEQRKKLSKRRDPVALEDYRSRGYLPEAMCNYLALLGWSAPDGAEVLTREEMVRTFRLEDLGTSPAFFDTKKLDHLNGLYVRALSIEEFIERCEPWLDRTDVWEPEAFDASVFRRMAPLVQERVQALSEVPAMVDFLFRESPLLDDASWEKVVLGQEDSARILDAALVAYADCAWERDVLHAVTAALGEELGLKLSKAQAPIRVAVTGRRVGPPLFESLEVLGRERTRTRLRAALDRLPGR
ncbi:MAG: glutamate--tRNA ligase [Acidimicrobiales bacterium]